MNTTIVEKMHALAGNLEFTQKFESAKNEQELLSILKEYGVDATENDIIQFLTHTDPMEDELNEDLLDNVSGGGKIWNWIKDRLNNWFKKQSKKNADDIGNILSRMNK